MGENSKIEWTDHTFNIAWGCTKVSPGCANCYAETFDKRVGGDHWGPGKPRRLFGEKHWNEPRKWNKAAAKAGVRHRVFCSSMADVFDHEIPDTERAKLWTLIRETPALDWLLLTKRPENIARMLPPDWGEGYANVWLGTTVEDQQRAVERIPHLIEIPARVRFLSCEPLLGPVDFARAEREASDAIDPEWRDGRRGVPLVTFLGDRDIGDDFHRDGKIHWVIVGGESGHGARPMHPDWARSIRDQCVAAGVAFHMKQWGEHSPFVDESKYTRGGAETSRNAQTYVNLDGSGGECWIVDDDGNWSNHAGAEPQPRVAIVTRIGKKAAGRVLDGRTWDEFPKATCGGAR